MNKTLIPALLVATIMVAGAFAFAPVEQASTVHLTGTTVASGITPTTTNPVNIATAAGSANVITVGNVAQVDTFVVAADTTLTGILTVTPTATDAINIATAGGAANVVTVGNLSQVDTFVVNADTTLTGITNIVPTSTDAVNIAAVGGAVNTITVGNGAQADVISLVGTIGLIGATEIGSATTGIQISTAGVITDENGNVDIADTMELGVNGDVISSIQAIQTGAVTIGALTAQVEACTNTDGAFVGLAATDITIGQPAVTLGNSVGVTRADFVNATTVSVCVNALDGTTANPADVAWNIIVIEF